MKGKLIKSFLSMLLCLALLASLLAACGGDGQSSQQSSSSSQQSSSKAESSSETESKDTAEPGEELPQLKMLINSANIDPNDYYVPKKMKELTGYDVVYDMLPSENSNDVLNLKMSGGSEYDIITVGSSNAMRAQMETFARQGALTQLDDLLEQYGQNLLDKVDPICWSMTEIDGSRYIIANKEPAVIPEGNIWCPFMVRTDWMKKMNIEEFPDTKEGLRDFLQAVKDQDPGGNGNLNIPLVLAPDSDFAMLRSAFDIYFNWNDIDGKLVPLVKDPRYKEYLQYMQDLYKDGLIDAEFPTNLGDTVTEKFTAGRAAVSFTFAMSYTSTQEALTANVPEATLDTFGPLKNSDGVIAATTAIGLNKLTVIPANSKHKEDAMKYMNLKCETETFKASVIGDEGVHHNATGENTFEPILSTFTEELNDAHIFLCGADDDNYGIYWREVRVKKDPLGYKAMKKLEIDHPEIARVDPLAISPLLPTYAENSSALDTLLRDFELTVITGAASVDDVDSFADRYMAEGGSDIEAEINEWWSGYRDTYIENYGSWMK